jgi:hypothetical protein
MEVIAKGKKKLLFVAFGFSHNLMGFDLFWTSKVAFILLFKKWVFLHFSHQCLFLKVF